MGRGCGKSSHENRGVRVYDWVDLCRRDPIQRMVTTPRVDSISFTVHPGRYFVCRPPWVGVTAPAQAGVGVLGIFFPWTRPPGAEPNRNVLAAGSGRV